MATGLAIGLVIGAILGIFIMASIATAKEEDLCPRCNSGMMEHSCSWCGYQVGDKLESFDC